MFCFVFPHPQFLSLSYFPSSNIVTHLWQQLHIQLVTSDVNYHSEKESFNNTTMTLNVRGKTKQKKQCLYFIVWPGLSFHNIKMLLGWHKLTLHAAHVTCAAEAKVLPHS